MGARSRAHAWEVGRSRHPTFRSRFRCIEPRISTETGSIPSGVSASRAARRGAPVGAYIASVPVGVGASASRRTPSPGARRSHGGARRGGGRAPRRHVATTAGQPAHTATPAPGGGPQALGAHGGETTALRAGRWSGGVSPVAHHAGLQVSMSHGIAAMPLTSQGYALLSLTL